jgi:hypothetical protein
MLLCVRVRVCHEIIIGEKRDGDVKRQKSRDIRNNTDKEIRG